MNPRIPAVHLRERKSRQKARVPVLEGASGDPGSGTENPRRFVRRVQRSRSRTTRSQPHRSKAQSGRRSRTRSAAACQARQQAKSARRGPAAPFPWPPWESGPPRPPGRRPDGEASESGFLPRSWRFPLARRWVAQSCRARAALHG